MAAWVEGVILVGFTRESISPLVGALAGNVDAVRDTNVAQLFDIVDRLQTRVIISLVTDDRVGEREMW